MKRVDMILFMGQSNMAGRGCAEEAPLVEKGMGYEFRAIAAPDCLWHLEEPFGKDENDPSGVCEPGMKTGSLVSAFVNAYTKETKIPVVGISCAKGGSAVSEWIPGTLYYQDAVRRVGRCERYLKNHGIEIAHRLMVWCQGCTDGDLHTDPHVYQQKTAQLLRALQKECGLETCFLIQIGNHREDAELYRPIQEAQLILANNEKDVVLVSRQFAAFAERGLMKDSFHYTQEAYNLVGEEAGTNAGRYVSEHWGLCTLPTSNELTVYWEKPGICRGKKGYTYQIRLNGEVKGKTESTHIQLKGLEAQTWYMLQAEVLDEQGRAVLYSRKTEVWMPEKKQVIDITKAPYGAIGDVKTLNTAAIQRAFDDCGKHQQVYIPRGTFLTGALRLHSQMEIYIEEGGILQGTANPEDYLPKIPSRFEGYERMCYSSLLNLGERNFQGDYNCRDILIHGKGTIASGGKELAFRVIESERELLKEEIAALGEAIEEYENENTIPGRARPRLIQMCNCQNVRISGLSLENGASWNVHMIYSDQIVTDHCTFRSEDVWNGDGWDPDSSTNCTIFACDFYTGDDSVAIKSGKNPEGNVIGRPSSQIQIFDCKCAYGHGIAMGSEMSGGIEKVKIWDCDLSRSLYGIEMKGTRKRGGYIREIEAFDCKVPRILIHSVSYNDDGEAASAPPIFCDYHFSNLEVTGEYMDKDGEWHECAEIEACGFEEEAYHIRNLKLENINYKKPKSEIRILKKYCTGMQENI